MGTLVTVVCTDESSSLLVHPGRASGRDGGAGEPTALGSSPDALAFMALAGKIAG